MPLQCDVKFEKGEKKLGKRQFEPGSIASKKTTAHALPSAPLELMNHSRFL